MPIKVWHIKDDSDQELIFDQQISDLPTSELRLRVCRTQDNSIEFLDRVRRDDDPDDLGNFKLTKDSQLLRLSCAAEQLSHPTKKSQKVITLHDQDTVQLFLPPRPAPLPHTSSQNESCPLDACPNQKSQGAPESVLTSSTRVQLFFSITAETPAVEELEASIEDSESLVQETQFYQEAGDADRPSYYSSVNPESEESGPSSEDSQPLVQETQFLDQTEGLDRPVYKQSFESQVSSSCCSDDDSSDMPVMQVNRDASEDLVEGAQMHYLDTVKVESATKSDDTEMTHTCTSQELKEGLLGSVQDDMKADIAHGDDDVPHEDDMDTKDDADEDADQDDPRAVPTILPPFPVSAEQASSDVEHDGTRIEDVEAQLDDAQDIEEEIENTTTNDGEEGIVERGITRLTPKLGAVSTGSRAELDEDDEELPDADALIKSSARPAVSITPQATDHQSGIEDAVADYEHHEHDLADQEYASDKPVEKMFASINKTAAKKKSKAKGKVHALDIATEDEDLSVEGVDPPPKSKLQQKKAKAIAPPTKKRRSTGSLKGAQEDDDTETCDSLFEEPTDLPSLKKRRSSGPAAVEDTPVAKKAAPKQKKTSKTPARKASKSATATPSTVSTIKKVAFSYSATVDRPAVLQKFFHLGYKKAEHVSPQCDLLVVGAGALQRTVKLLVAIARGTAIVTDDFVTRCAEHGQVPAPSGYSPGGISDMGVSRNKLFFGKELYITPALREVYKFEYLNIVELTKIIGFKSTTSTAVRGLKKSADSIVLGYGEDDINAITLMEEGTTCYTKDFLSASILRNEVDLEDEEFQMTCKTVSSKAASKTKSAQPVSKVKGSQPVSKAKGSQKDKRRTKSM